MVRSASGSLSRFRSLRDSVLAVLRLLLECWLSTQAPSQPFTQNKVRSVPGFPGSGNIHTNPRNAIALVQFINIMILPRSSPHLGGIVRNRRGLAADLTDFPQRSTRNRILRMAEPGSSGELFDLPVIKMAETGMKEYCKDHHGSGDDERCAKAMKWLESHLEAAKEAATGSKDGGSATGSYDALYQVQATLQELAACGVPQMIETLATLQRAAVAAAKTDPLGEHAKAQQKLVEEHREQLAQV